MPIRDVAAKFAPSTVVVRSGDSRGTGFIVSSAGYVLTCAHVLEPAEEVRVLFVDPDHPGVAAADGAATIVAQDHELDIALLRYDPPLNPAPVRFSTEVRSAAGESVTVISNPGFGTETLEQTVTTGVVSAPARTLGERSLIQISSAINPGSSGGAAFDDQGRVIGMVTRKGAIEGAGFAIPAGELIDFLLRSADVDDDSLGLQRTWVDRASGRELTAEIVSIGESSVTVRDAKRDRAFEIPFERLSEDDVRFLEAILARRQAPAKKP
jgi:S1-C subfamily serine protease